MSETYTNNVGRSDYRLPTVNANDNGKILKVVEGEWKKAEGGGGSSLPEYGESDAGKVLKVAEGGESVEWSEAGGGSPLLVNITTQDNIVFTMDKTYSEIKAAASSSGVLCIIDFPGEYTNIFSVIGFYEEVGGSHSVYLPDLMGLTGGVSPYVFFTASSTSGYPTFGEQE